MRFAFCVFLSICFLVGVASAQHCASRAARKKISLSQKARWARSL
jgi:hypothetical protein